MNVFIEVEVGSHKGMVNIRHITKIWMGILSLSTKETIPTNHSYDELIEMIQKATPGINRLKSK